MRISGKVSNYTDTHILIKAENFEKELLKRIKKCGGGCELYMLDKRLISSKQRKKAHVIINEVAEYMGEAKENAKYILKGKFLEDQEELGYRWFSLKDCSVEIAYEFINYLIGFCLEQDIPTRDTLLSLCDDIERYMYMCLKHKKCAICGRPGVVHHIDAIGMGRNRKKIDDSQHLKICLCSDLYNDRKDGTQGSCHDVSHRLGWPAFSKKYHVVGILYVEED